MALQTVNVCANSNLRYLACALSYVLIQNDLTRMNFAHQRTLTYSTRLPIASVQKSGETYRLHSVCNPRTHRGRCAVGKSVLNPCTEFWVQHHIQMGNKH